MVTLTLLLLAFMLSLANMFLHAICFNTMENGDNKEKAYFTIFILSINTIVFLSSIKYLINI